MKQLLTSPYELEALRKPSVPVTEFGSALDSVIDDMTWVLRTLVSNGMGISAVQCNEHLRIGLMIDPGSSYKERIMTTGKLQVICNPQLLDSDGNVIGEEGCLSFPGQFIKVIRPQLIRIKYQDKEGKEKFSFYHHIWARCILHEMDHMDGVLFIDKEVK